MGLKKLGENYDADKLERDLNHLDTYYLGGGWSSDGPGCKQMDYYSGPFAIQTSQLIYSKIAAEDDPVRCEEYRRRALMYAVDHIHYFDPEGMFISPVASLFSE